MANLTKTLTVPKSDGSKVQYSFNATQFNSKTPGYYENLPFVTCSTAAGTAGKAVTCAGFELVDGARIAVKFSNTNTAASPTLNVSSTGAKPIYYKNAAISAGYLTAGAVMEFIYNATNQRYELIGFVDTNSDLKTASGPTTSKIYLIGATTRSTSGQTTLAHETAFVDTSGVINSKDPIAGSTSTVVTSAQKGVANGVAPLDVEGKISASYLPSYVDDVIEGELESDSSFTASSGKVYTKPVTDEDTQIEPSTGKIYVDTNSNKTYRWSGTKFVEISAGTYSTTIVGGSTTATSNAAVSSNGIYLNEVYNGTAVTSHKISGSGGVDVTSDASGNITIGAPTASEIGAITSVSATGTAPLTLNATKSGTAVSITGSVAQATTSANGTIKVAGVRTSAITPTTGGTTSSRYYGVELDSAGKAFVNVPWTDTKVTSVGNHYTPAEDSNSVLDVNASSTTSATWGSTDLVTGVTLKRDAKGHVVGLTVDSIQMPANPDTNTTYSAGTGISLSGTTFSNSGVRSITQDSTNGHKLTINTGGTETTITIPDNNTTYGIATSSTLGLVKSGGDITINSSTGVMSVVDDSHNHVISNVDGLQDALNGKAPVHDHPYLSSSTKYAASATQGGSATSAVKLDTTTAGDASTPVYFTDGKPTACTSLDLNTTGTAAAWTTARTLTVNGDASGSVSVKGNANMTLTLSVADDSHNHIIGNVDGLEDRLAAIEDRLTWHEF